MEPKIRRLIKETLVVKYGIERWIDPILKVSLAKNETSSLAWIAMKSFNVGSFF